MLTSSLPLFSVIITTYNRAHIISRAIDSILAQEYTNWEIIIIDDASTDHTKQIIDNYNHPKITCFRNEKNYERSVSRNRGIELSKGEFICILDSDDYFLPNHLSSIYSAIQQQENPVALYYTQTLFYYEKENCKKERVMLPKKQEHWVLYFLKNFLAPLQVCIHHSILKQHKFKEDIITIEDMELWLCIAASFPVVPIHTYTAVEVIHSSNSTSRANNVAPNQIKGLKLMFSNKELSRHIPLKIQREELGGRYYLKAMYHEHKKELLRMYQSLLLSFFYDPFHFDYKGKLVMIIYNFPFIGSIIKNLLKSR